MKDEVIVDLVERCRSNQKKLMQMLTSTGLVFYSRNHVVFYFFRMCNDIVDLRGFVVVLNSLLICGRDDELLGRGLDLNDSLQTLLAKHDAIASGSPLPIQASGSPLSVQASKPADSSPKSSEAKDSSSVAGSSSPIPATVSSGKSPIDEEYEEEEDEFAQLARRSVL